VRALALGNSIRVEFAINKVGSTVTVVAATGELATGTGCTTGSGALRKSVDGGATWSAKLAGGGGFCGTQCAYNIAVAMDPDDANLIYLGGSANSTCSRVYVRSTDGGRPTLRRRVHATACPHPRPATPTSYTGNDGGIWRSTDAAQTWTSLNNTGFNATQFQSLALHPIDREFMIGGTQDNGTQYKRPDATWFRADFGDGGFALVDQSATDTENVTMYHTTNQTNAMGFVVKAPMRSRGTGALRLRVRGVKRPQLLTRGQLHPLLRAHGPRAGHAQHALLRVRPALPLHRSRGDHGPGQPGAPPVLRGGERHRHLSPGRQRAPRGHALRAVYATHNGSSALVNVTGLWPASATLASQPRRFVSRVVVDPTSTDVAYVTFATYCTAGGLPAAGCAQVYKTSNLTTALAAAALPTWTPANSGIPDVPVSAFVVDPRDPNQLFAGTDIGVYRSGDGGLTWLPYGTGFPRVAVFDMALHAPTGTLRVATHGRGIWEIAAGNATPALASLASPTIGLGGGPTLLYGFIKAGSLVPPGSVDITVNGTTQSAPIMAGTMRA
jgi:hypothetical protein